MENINTEECQDFSKAKIYIVKSNVGPKFYIGSTCLTLQHRLKKHLNKYKSEYENCASIKQLFDEYTIKECKIELLEKYHCNTRQEMLQKEAEYYRKYENDPNMVNQMAPYSTQEETRLKNLESHKKWLEINRDDYNLKRREQWANLPEEDKRELLDSRKPYFEKYREEHRDELNEKASQVIECPICFQHQRYDTINQSRHKNTIMCKTMKKLHEEGNMTEQELRDYASNFKENQIQENAEKRKEKAQTPIPCFWCLKEVTPGKMKNHNNSIYCKNIQKFLQENNWDQNDLDQQKQLLEQYQEQCEKEKEEKIPNHKQIVECPIYTSQVQSMELKRHQTTTKCLKIKDFLDEYDWDESDYEMRLHLLSIFNEEEQKEKAKKNTAPTAQPHQCNYCFKTFASKSNLTRHIKKGKCEKYNELNQENQENVQDDN